jgi:hypothetical protein
MDKIEQHNQKLNSVANRLPAWVLSLVLLFVGLGNFTDSIELLKNVYESIYSKFSNSVEYDRTQRVRTGLNLNYLQGYIGQPQILKKLDGDIEVQHYIDEKYIVTLFVSQQRVNAYLIIARQDHFQPSTQGISDEDLGDQNFAQISRNTDHIVFEASRNIAYYIESKELNFGGGYLTNSYLAWIDYAANFATPPTAALEALYNAEILGNKRDGELDSLRNNSHPNAFGFGELKPEVIQSGLLTRAELNFFN